MVENTVQNQPLAENFTNPVVAEAMQRGEQYLTNGHFLQAREQFQRVTDTKADYAPAYRGLGRAAKGMIDGQLKQPHGTVDRHLLEEARTELARAYRLGARDVETVWALANLYHQFGRCQEYVDLLWDFAMTTNDFKVGFDAGCKSLFEMQQDCVADYERAVNAHQVLLKKFEAQATLADTLHSYCHVANAYHQRGRADDWLKQTAHLAEQRGEEILMMEQHFYIRERGEMLRKLECYREAAQTFEVFIDWIQNTEELHPHKQFLLIEMQGLYLLPTYHQLGERHKVEAILTEAELNLEQYVAERDSMLASITDESEATRQRLDAMYGEVETYPAGGGVAEVRDWLDREYFKGIGYATHNLAAGCSKIGEGEVAICLFTRVAQHWEQRLGRINGNLLTWLAMMMLKFRNDRDASLEYLKRASEDGRWAASGQIKRTFEKDTAFDFVRNDPKFLAVVNAPVINK